MNQKILHKKKLENIMFPELISPLQHEFKYWNDKLSNLLPKSMFRLEKLEVLP